MARRDMILRSLVLTRFIVTMKSGESFDGLLQAVDESTLVFVKTEAVAVTPKGESRAPVDGLLYLPRLEVAYMQRVAS